MSIIIKSNNALSTSSAGFGTTKMLNTTVQAEFDAYKARVIADGGVIKDEARTLSAFNMLFNNKMYGNMNTAVSGTFGVKLDTNSGITKLYAIDGTDLIGTAYGTGVLPKLDANNNIDFSSNVSTDNVNGAMFSTASKLTLSKMGRFGYAINAKTLKSTTTRLAAITKHADVTASNSPSYITANTTVSLSVTSQLNTLMLSGTPTVVSTNAGFYNAPHSYITLPSDNLFAQNRGGTEVTTARGKFIPEIVTEQFYLDFGGQFTSDKKQFTDTVIRDFFSFSHASRGQAAALSAFS